MKNSKSFLSSVAASLLGALFATSADAHEARLIANGLYEIVVGWHVEPLVANQANAMDFFADVEDPAGSGTFAFLDRNEGDKVEIAAVPMRFDTDNFNSKDPLQVAAHLRQVYLPLTNFQRCDDASNLFGLGPCEDGVGYEKPFTPNRAGAFGFLVSGEIKRHNHNGQSFAKKSFVQTFVCGQGSQSPDSSFDCVQ